MKNRGMCILCRRKRYVENLIRCNQIVTLFPKKQRIFRYNVCSDSCVNELQNIKLENHFEILSNLNRQ